MMLASNRAVAVTLALFILVVCPSLARGLGLGDITLDSRLNEPLDASIRLVQLDGLEADRIQVDMASRDAFERSGIAYPSFLDDISFSVDVRDRDTGVLTLSTERPVLEPYLDLIIDVRWPGGRMMREYTTLVDPPQFTAVTPEAPDIPASPEDADASAVERSAEARSPSQQPAGSASDMETAEVGTDDALSGAVTEEGGYRVGTDETLWEIAADTRRDDSVSVQQMMLAIQRDNPRAFIDGNINTLRADAVLRIPAVSDPVMPGQSEALAEVQRQNRSAGLLDSAPLTPPASGPAGTDAAEDELRVLSADEETAAGEGGGNGQDEQIAELEMQLMMSEEALDRARLENRELVTRLDEMNSQIELLDNIIELEDARLAELQAELAEAGTDTAAPPQADKDPADNDPAGGTGTPAADTGMAAAERETGPTPVTQPSNTWLGNPWLLLAVVALLIALVVGLLIVRRRRLEAMEETLQEESFATVRPPRDSLDHGDGGEFRGELRGERVSSLAAGEAVQEDALTLEDITDTERLWQDDNVILDEPAGTRPADDEFRAPIAEADRLAGAGEERPDDAFVEFNLATAADEEPVAEDSSASRTFPAVDPDNTGDGQADDEALESFDFRLDDLLQDIDESPGQVDDKPAADDIETFDYSPAESGHDTAFDNDDVFDLGDLTFDEDDLDAADDSDEVADDEDEPHSGRIDLAVAYEAMGDPEGARRILQQVLEEGDENDKAEARRLLEEWGGEGEAV